MSTNTDTGTALDTSAAAGSVSGESQTPGSGANVITPERFNGLMSTFNKEESRRKTAEAEVERLQGLLAAAVVSKTGLEARIVELEAGSGTKASELEQKSTELSSKVTELAAEIARLTAQNTRLSFLVNNEDILVAKDLIPETSDPEALKRAADAFRRAQQGARQEVKDHMLGAKGGGGGPGRTVVTSDPKAMEDYLRAGIADGTYYQRLAELTGRPVE